MVKYKGKEYDVKTGPRGGSYIILENGVKHYIKNNTKTPTWKYLSCYVPDPEHEGDIDHELFNLRKIGDIEVIDIEREYTEDGEELTYACINFKCKDSDYIKFYKYCEGNY